MTTDSYPSTSILMSVGQTPSDDSKTVSAVRDRDTESLFRITIHKTVGGNGGPPTVPRNYDEINAIGAVSERDVHDARPVVRVLLEILSEAVCEYRLRLYRNNTKTSDATQHLVADCAAVRPHIPEDIVLPRTGRTGDIDDFWIKGPQHAKCRPTRSAASIRRMEPR